MRIFEAACVLAASIAAGMIVVPAVIGWSAAASKESIAGCRQPTQHEQLHLIIAWRDQRLVRVDCFYVTSRGGARLAQ